MEGIIKHMSDCAPDSPGKSDLWTFLICVDQAFFSERLLEAHGATVDLNVEMYSHEKNHGVTQLVSKGDDRSLPRLVISMFGSLQRDMSKNVTLPALYCLKHLIHEMVHAFIQLYHDGRAGDDVHINDANDPEGPRAGHGLAFWAIYNHIIGVCESYDPVLAGLGSATELPYMSVRDMHTRRVRNDIKALKKRVDKLERSLEYTADVAESELEDSDTEPEWDGSALRRKRAVRLQAEQEQDERIRRVRADFEEGRQRQDEKLRQALAALKRAQEERDEVMLWTQTTLRRMRIVHENHNLQLRQLYGDLEEERASRGIGDAMLQGSLTAIQEDLSARRAPPRRQRQETSSSSPWLKLLVCVGVALVVLW
ncbi:Uu.00g101540.m01.CDS01 [Anthostomella pinea]|uniref:Uu.00g101540.m01.CDS01 n=1 Tax=Anthostomella pinea TaxID=933095 RepID=A0AAI8VD87_9PEZI|nr:Uu.00g101540.m01.CDS01 [Anthostomella pinea]